MRPMSLLLLALFAAAPLHGQDLTTFSTTVHGFGSWAYGRTNKNVYLSGTPEGEFRRVNMALNLSARVDENVTIHAQGEVSEDEDLTHLSLSYAFAEYPLSDALTFRIGQVKHPF